MPPVAHARSAGLPPGTGARSRGRVVPFGQSLSGSNASSTKMARRSRALGCMCHSRIERRARAATAPPSNSPYPAMFGTFVATDVLASTTYLRPRFELSDTSFNPSHLPVSVLCSLRLLCLLLCPFCVIRAVYCTIIRCTTTYLIMCRNASHSCAVENVDASRNPLSL